MNIVKKTFKKIMDNPVGGITGMYVGMSMGVWIKKITKNSNYALLGSAIFLVIGGVLGANIESKIKNK